MAGGDGFIVKHLSSIQPSLIIYVPILLNKKYFHVILQKYVNLVIPLKVQDQNFKCLMCCSEAKVQHNKQQIRKENLNKKCEFINYKLNNKNTSSGAGCVDEGLFSREHGTQAHLEVTASP